MSADSIIPFAFESLPVRGALIQLSQQIQGSGTLQMLVMQCTSDLDVRGMAAIEEGATASSFAELTNKAHCAITVDSGERPYQGIVAIEGESFSSSLAHYFDRSVQVPSHIVLVANERIAGGILLQQMPGKPIDEDDWNRLHFLAETLTSRDFESDTG